MQPALITMLAASLGASIALAPAARAEGPKGSPLATVDGEPITSETLKQAAEAMGPRGDAMLLNPQLRKQFLDHMIDSRLAARAAVKDGLDRSAEYQQKLDEAKRQILASLYIKQYVDGHTKPEDVKAFFERDPVRFSKKEIRCSHVLVKTEEEALEVLKKAQAGVDFDGLAKEYSAGPSAPKGGDLGYFHRGRMVPEFEAAAFKTPKGTIYPKPVKTAFGYHVIKVLDVRGTDEVAFADVQERVLEALELEVRDQMTTALRAKAKVAVDEGALKRYQ